ncbi:Indole-3-glycerol phosphate synthase [Corynebacterium pseudotuberculosis]|nr:Indole-3-glycerol phosphate synthase [Corynebacterium pseudotuberculosis PAT10]AEP70587.1 Indole-3-glycerol phosphate synthase [Corynebacterium pseudotuberculosis 42/02-A]AFF22504.1 Indole-3-glycerol phosphate synthase [Corynebacterium pseudotuberculosis P54B96]AFH52303.1 Indole-3-glycerol phosphate synthase [Corynebacterium pseudotuberculosis 267]AJC14086.1 Indole-3-glycerol phosphate synthase [Corynebacterium pseudotuberculosis]
MGRVMPSVFEEIIAGVIEDVAARESVVSFKEIKARSRACEPPRDAIAALLNSGCGVIAEIKRAAPDKGVLAEINSPVGLAKELVAGGASLIACQTERRRFHGSLSEMAEIRNVISVPIMCRDFIVDPYQIHEARCYGADMVPLRVAALDQARMIALIDRIESLGMAALVEVRDTEEASRAVAAGAKIIGVNARDFSTMTLNRLAFAEIAPGLPTDVIRVALSGVRNARELLDYAASGADAVVVGEKIVTAADPCEATRSLVAAGQHPSCPSRG